MPDINALSQLGIDQALRSLKNKGVDVKGALTPDQLSKTFTISGIAKMDLLQDVKRDIEKAIEAGTSVDDFKQNYLSTLKKHGWTGQTTADQKLVRPYRIEMIYRQSMDNAYAVGRFYELKAESNQYPYWEYVTKRDNRVRPKHKLLDGIIRRHDDPFWDSHTPPLDFSCRCLIQQVTDGRTNKGTIPQQQIAGDGFGIAPTIGSYLPQKIDYSNPIWQEYKDFKDKIDNAAKKEIDDFKKFLDSLK